MTLRDAVRTATNAIGQAARERFAAAPPEDRPAAFRRLIASEIGDTWLRRSRAIERDYGLADVFLKLEGDNRTGTQKDRIAFAQVADALDRGMTDVALATCGNYGVAVSLAASIAGLRCHVYVPAAYHTERLPEMAALGAVVYRPDGSYEEVVEFSSAEARRLGYYDANPGGANAELQIEAYAGIGREILRQLPGPPTYCAVPVSNGTLLAGVYRGLSGASVRMVAASSTAKNPIVYSARQGLATCVDLDPAKIRETKINEPLINWHSFDGQEALEAVRQSGGSAHNISDARLRKMAHYLAEREALRALPAATAGLIALLLLHEAGHLPPGPHVAVLTAKR